MATAAVHALHRAGVQLHPFDFTRLEDLVARFAAELGPRAAAWTQIVRQAQKASSRRTRRADLDDVILCVDQSGSMATSVVYSSIFAAVMASIPAIATRFVVFDTSVVDLTEQLSDPVEVLFGVQLGGGTDINQALAYCQGLVRQPAKTTSSSSPISSRGETARKCMRAQLNSLQAAST